MATLVREAGTQLITNFTVPYKGTWLSLPANVIPADSVYNSMNVFVRAGKLRSRPGLTLLNATVFNAPILGGAMAVMPGSKVLVAITKNSVYELPDTASIWTATTTMSTYAPNDDSIIDMTFIETTSQYVGLVAQEAYQLKQWTVGAGVYPLVATIGAVPFAKSVCVAARRVVALVEPHTIVWTAINDITNWPALAFNKVAQTNDVGICVKQLSNLSFVVYKERSIYVVRSNAGSDAQAFTFNEPLKVEGPAGIHAVVDVNGTHMYMTKNGRVGIFDGTAYPDWVADGIWLYLQDNIDPQYAYKIFGVFDYRLHTVTFHYPRVGDGGAMYGVVILCLPLEQSGIESIAPFLGVTEKPCSYGYEQRFNDSIDRSIVFTATPSDFQSFIFDEDGTTDDGVIFDCSVQTPLVPLTDMKHYQLSVEIYFQRAMGNGRVFITPVVMDAMETEGGTVVDDAVTIINLNDNPVNEYVGFNIPTRFFGLRYSWTSDNIVKYGGCSVYGRVTT